MPGTLLSPSVWRETNHRYRSHRKDRRNAVSLRMEGDESQDSASCHMAESEKSLPPYGGRRITGTASPDPESAGLSPSVWRETNHRPCKYPLRKNLQSPSVWRETNHSLPPCGGSGLKYLQISGISSRLYVSLHAEGVD